MKLKTALATALLAASTYVVPIHANAAGGGASSPQVLRRLGGWKRHRCVYRREPGTRLSGVLPADTRTDES